MSPNHKISKSSPSATRRSSRLAQARLTASVTALPSPTTTLPSLATSAKDTAKLPSCPSNPSAPLYFWRENEPSTGYLSQWYPARMTQPGSKVVYKTAEHYMMHQKSLLFASPAALQARILSASHPRLCRTLGRQIPNFDDGVWAENRERIVLEGNLLKFSSAGAGDEGARLRGLLLGSGEGELVEASPFDRVWGIGFREKDAEKAGRGRWGGNLLGKALMEVRRMLRAEEDEGRKGNVGIRASNDEVEGGKASIQDNAMDASDTHEQMKGTGV